MIAAERPSHCGLSKTQAFQKRLFDLSVAIMGIVLVSWLIVLAWVVASIDTRQNGFFIQKRVGKYGKLFSVVKIRTMRNVGGIGTTVTTVKDPRVTRIGRMFRLTKIDELPQLVNILVGDMSFVGPRPDVPGFADRLVGEEKLILSVRPGITGPATLKYRNEEELLAEQDNPEIYNRDVIFPDKVQINLKYIKNWRFINDINYIRKTVFGR